MFVNNNERIFEYDNRRIISISISNTKYRANKKQSIVYDIVHFVFDYL